MKYRCPICKRIIKVSSQEHFEKAKFFPFCCRRCKLLDLGVWLDAEYRVISDPQPKQSGRQVDSRLHSHSAKQ